MQETIGTTVFGNGSLTVGSTYIQDNSWTPYQPYTYQYVWPSTPFLCDGNVHVFGCDHAEKCKCGKTKRKPEPPQCAHCGKAHS
jgi:hypothetical protein